MQDMEKFMAFFTQLSTYINYHMQQKQQLAEQVVDINKQKDLNNKILWHKLYSI